MSKSELQRALARAMQPGGDLSVELSNLNDYRVYSRRDARVICRALAKLPEHDAEDTFDTSPLHALTGLFQDVESTEDPAFEVLYAEGIPELIRIFDAIEGDENRDDELMFILKILVMYGSREGAEKVVEAARKPVCPNDYMWNVVLTTFSGSHPHRNYVFQALMDPLPSGFLAVSLLDGANNAAIEGDLRDHPFDSAAGKDCLRDWLASSDPGEFSYAHSATAALPFISNPERDELLALAAEHVDPEIKMEAAWAAGLLGKESGRQLLARFALDPRHSRTAQRYLGELDLEHLIPTQAMEPAFQAQAEFANWLGHPNELGSPPDELEIVDQRILDWPPEREPRPFWVIRYLLRDTSGLAPDAVDCGLVGSVTWCFFSGRMNQRPPEDVYAIHCYWEMHNDDLIVEDDVVDPTEYEGILEQWEGSALEGAEVRHAADIAPRLSYPGRLVAVASGTLEGDPGWVTLDGPRSAWYPESDFPEGTDGKTILRIHVGRHLLRLEEPAHRKSFLQNTPAPREPTQIVAAYEKLLDEADRAGPSELEDVLGGYQGLANNFDNYVEACVASRGAPRAEVIITLYQRLQALARKVEEAGREAIYDALGVLGKHFEQYTDALVKVGRAQEALPLLYFFAPYWDNNLGYGKLGKAAFKLGDLKLAERHLSALRAGYHDHPRSQEMDLLAEIWLQEGKEDAAKELLIGCLKELVADIKPNEYASDRRKMAEAFQARRATFLRLFSKGEESLATAGLPHSIR